MLRDDVRKIHTVELIAGENQHVIMGLVTQMLEIATNRVGGSLIPIAGLIGLLGREDIDETAAKRVEVERVLDVPVQRRSMKLGQDKDSIDARIDTIADRNIDEAVFARKRDSGLTTFGREGVQAGAATTAHDDCDYFFIRAHAWFRWEGVQMPCSTIGAGANFANLIVLKLCVES